MSRSRILVADLQAAVRLPVARLKRLARAVIDGEKLRPGDLSIAFVDRATMRKANRRFLRHDYDTDVLAFTLEAPMLGEIVISTDFALKESRTRGLPALEEVSRYLVHGILHLAGYDDHSPSKKRIMWKRQESYLPTPRMTRSGSARKTRHATGSG
ncbi:MAG TPA: rRNA maturation RNase YbeY [Planctomycetota bacterium]